MARTPLGVAQRLVRIAVAGGILSAAWLAIDLISHADPAAAAEQIDVDLPDAVGGVVDVVTSPLTPAITTVVQPAVVGGVAPITAPIVTTVAPVQPGIVAAAAPVVAALGAVAQPLAPAVEPLVPVTTAVLSPVATNVLVPLAPVIAAAVPPVVEIVQSLAPGLAVLGVPGLLVGGGALLALVVGTALPLSSAAPPGAPGKSPAPPHPALPTNTGGYSALDGIVGSGIPTLRGLREIVRGALGDLPASPTFAFDTTPD